MNYFDWLLLTATCFLGAMSPGPSLLCVMQHAFNDGRLAGVSAAIAHAFGVLLWAVFTVFAMHGLTEFLPNFMSYISLIGAVFLIYIGVKSLKANSAPQNTPSIEQIKFSAIRDGFSIAFLNPKLAIFFTAIFSQFLVFEPSSQAKIAMTLIASAVDGLWYIIVAFIVTSSGFKATRFARLKHVNTAAGVIFITLGLQVVFYTTIS